MDNNKNTLKDSNETNYTGSITIASTGGSVSSAGGAYTVSNLNTGTYTISYTDKPSGYQLTYPLNGPPPSFQVAVGGTCSTGGSNSATCSGGSIANLNFGITNSNPWIQCIGADCRVDSGFINKIPANASCGPYASLPGSGGTPGLVFTGNTTADFGQGRASQNDWVAGGISYGETYSPTKIGGQIKTSYSFLLSKGKPVDIASYCTGGISSCTLSSSLPHGIYIANGNLKLVGGGYTFGASQDFVILVKNGDLTIAEKIFVPVGSTAIFSSSGNITVDKAVGEAVNSSTTADIEGIYSADKNFIVQGTNDCSVGTDLRLNVGGSVITNASLNGGSFQNQRDLCAGNVQCPAFSAAERPDFILNSPNFLKQANFTYQEIAP
ncbi:MAG TPA: hypothetical protein VKC89_01055 [Patescibacteria group bacterium]|nr:hypothetical protein [Patescibacteria group bacterium]